MRGLRVDEKQADRFIALIERYARWIALGMAGLLFMGILSVGGLLLMVYQGAMQKTEVFQESWKLVQENSEVIRLLGAPLKVGWTVKGNIKIQGPEGEADFQYPVSGSLSWGVVRVRAQKKEGQWRYEQLEFELSGKREVIDLTLPTLPTIPPPVGSEKLKKLNSTQNKI